VFRRNDTAGRFSGSRAWFFFSSSTPKKKFTDAIELLGDRVSVGALLGGILLCCMALTASGVYHLKAEQLRAECEDRGLSSDGPVTQLRKRLLEYLEDNKMEGPKEEAVAQASVQTSLHTKVDPPVRESVGGCVHSEGHNSQMTVFCDLLNK
jgi:hypothetical protein